jgi:hypothetical protein
MGRTADNLRRLVDDLFVTTDDEIQCEEAAIQMALCAEALLSVEASQQQYPQLWRHLRFCADCANEYHLLLELAHQEAAGQLKRPARLPLAPLSKLPPVGSLSWATPITALFAGFHLVPAQLAARQRGQSLGIEPVRMNFADGRLALELDIEASDSDPALRDLYCRVETDDPQMADACDGAPIWLEREISAAIEYEGALDELGGAILSGVAPGAYSLHLRLAGQEYTLLEVKLP